MRTTPRKSRAAIAAAAIAVPALALTACGSSGSSSSTTSTTVSSSPSASGSSSATGSASTAATPTVTPAVKGDLTGITVGGTDAAPKLAIAGNKFTATQTTVKVLKDGEGEPLKAGEQTQDSIVVASGSNGATVYDSFATGRKETWTVGDPNMLAGVSKALIGQKRGARLLVAMPPADAFGAKGQPQLKIPANDTLVMLIQIAPPAPKPLDDVSGATVAPKAGFPTVVATKGKAATITIPKTAAPTTLQQETLVEGTGKVVQKGQTLQAHYTGVLWATGKKFDSSYDHGTTPAEFPIGTGGVIPAWDKVLVGKKIGSRVVIVAPPTEAYGAQGQPPTIPANSTLVFVVDILGAY